jgi:hypothetical protein
MKRLFACLAAGFVLAVASSPADAGTLGRNGGGGGAVGGNFEQIYATQSNKMPGASFDNQGIKVLKYPGGPVIGTVSKKSGQPVDSVIPGSEPVYCGGQCVSDVQRMEQEQREFIERHGILTYIPNKVVPNQGGTKVTLKKNGDGGPNNIFDQKRVRIQVVKKSTKPSAPQVVLVPGATEVTLVESGGEEQLLPEHMLCARGGGCVNNPLDRQDQMNRQLNEGLQNGTIQPPSNILYTAKGPGN